MGEAEEVERGGRAPGRRVAVAGAIAGGIAAIALGTAWLERAPIVAHFVDRALGARGAPARYRITALGPFAQRLEDVAIGDPRRPDLLVRRLDLHIGYGASGPYVTGVEAEGVRLRARVIDGRVSLGALDRLLPASSGGPLRLPDLAVRLADARAAIATPAGPVDLAIDGAGNLADGFRARLAAASPRLALAGCTLTHPSARIALAIDRRRPRVAGPAAIAGATCTNGLAVGAGRATLDLAFAATLDRWRGSVAPVGFAGTTPGARFGAVGGAVGVVGTRERISGDVRLAVAGIAGQGMAAREALAHGRYRYAAASGLVYAGDLALGHAALSSGARRAILRGAAAARGTPLAPLAGKAVRAAAALLADAHVAATVALTAGGPMGLAARVRRLALTGRSGGTVRIAEGAGFGWNLAERGWRADGRLVTAGGGLPAIDLTLRQPRVGAPVSGRATLAPYAAGDARLALAPVTFTSAAGQTRFATVATIDGGMAGLRADGLVLPLAGRFGGEGLVLGAGCTPIRVRRLRLAGAEIDDGAVRACGVGKAPLLRVRADGTAAAGAVLHDVRLAGRSGASPLALAADRLVVDRAGVDAAGVAVRLGAGDAQTRLDVAALAGRFDGGVAGSFAGAGGRIARVPLALSGAGGTWRVADGALVLDGALTVADSDTPPRFLPLAARDVSLRLADGRITARGALAEPRSGAGVAEVTIAHDLAAGRGEARLAVRDLTFRFKGLQPEALTPLTLGVVANVEGTVTGEGRIAWDDAGVHSTGDFATERLDLAAAFGPVTGIAGRIHFADLLGLATPPHQEATVAEVNPGVAVTGGVLHYQLLPGFRLAVEDARWPFAGGALTLDPGVLAFGADSERRLTFRLRGLDAAAFVNQLALPNLNATGTFDGTLPMIFDQSGGRIAGGAIVARPPGGTIAYVGQLSQEQVGTMGRLAFDALKAIRYRSLSIDLDGRLDGEIVSRVRFDGIRQATPDAGLLARMIHNLPFRFNISVRAPFRSLLGTARSYVDPSLLLKGGLPVPGTSERVAPDPGVQPPVSGPVR